jgi:hypothetical protein
MEAGWEGPENWKISENRFFEIFFGDVWGICEEGD